MTTNINTLINNVQNTNNPYNVNDRADLKRSEQKSSDSDVREQVSEEAVQNNFNATEAVLRLDSSDAAGEEFDRGSFLDITV